MDSDSDGQLRGKRRRSNRRVAHTQSGTSEPDLHSPGSRLQESEKMVAMARLASGVAHDVNNLLTVISGYGQMLEDAIRRESRTEQLSSYVEELRRAADRAADLADQLLAFSRRSKLRPQKLDVAKLIAELAPSMQSVLGAPIELVIHAQDANCVIQADPAQIQRAVMNLAIAAREAMQEGGRLLITTAIHAQAAGPTVDRVLLEFSDTGHGLSEAAQERIFEPYFGFMPDGRGMGLSLATVYGIVKQSLGDIEVESEVNRGTKFRLYFPLYSGDVLNPGEEKCSLPVIADELRGDATVLLVEDDEVVRSLVTRMLERYGYEAIVAAGAREALRLFRDHQNRIGLLLTDIVMPETDGRELALLLCRAAPTLKVLYMSGYVADHEIEEQAIVDGEALLLRKPFTPEVLARHVRQALDQPLLQR